MDGIHYSSSSSPDSRRWRLGNAAAASHEAWKLPCPCLALCLLWVEIWVEVCVCAMCVCVSVCYVTDQIFFFVSEK